MRCVRRRARPPPWVVKEETDPLVYLVDGRGVELFSDLNWGGRACRLVSSVAQSFLHRGRPSSESRPRCRDGGYCNGAGGMHTRWLNTGGHRDHNDVALALRLQFNRNFRGGGPSGWLG